MDKRYPTNIWEALGKLYLTDSEIVDTVTKPDKTGCIPIIKKRFFLDLWEKMENAGETSPPFLLRSDFLSHICKALIRESNSVQWGNLELHDDHFLININKDLSENKKRTVLAHELGHTFLFDTQTWPIKEIYHRERSLDFLSPNVYDKDEGFVYEIGRFLLVPSKVMRRYIDKTPSLSSFLKACSLFKTSKEVMAKRLFWDIYNFDSHEKYWSSALLIFYSIQEDSAEISWEIPKGNKYIYRGDFFKNFQYADHWNLMIPLLNKALKSPDILIQSSLIERKKMRQIIFKGSKIDIELKFLPKDKRIYILLKKK
jgi:hypothetical protein